ncbi:MAG: four-carbon acid sugar kinase family protein [Beijerinckiaceae bacterium]
MPDRLPQGPLIAFYGDDFTGSTAVMEILAFAGLETILFLGLPTPEQLASVAHMRAIGMAGYARACAPQWMSAELPRYFAALKKTGAPLVHYKVCSTFDSAPHTGSIGKAIDLGADMSAPGSTHIPVVVGAPAIGRYQIFGNLFAAVHGRVHRLDRHPVMAHHPVTPMDEADLTRHLARQTARRIGLIDCAALARDGGAEALDACAGPDGPVIFIDVMDAPTLEKAGALLWQNRAAAPFVAGSQGVEYALVSHWRAIGALASQKPAAPAPAIDQIAVVSGSCSPITAQQIHQASAHGFALIRLAVENVIGPEQWQAALASAIARACTVLSTSGHSPLIYSAAGPDDPAIPALAHTVQRAGLTMPDASRRLGQGLGTILREIVTRTALRRTVIAGGDSSGAAMGEMGIHALSALAPLSAGAPLCRAHADDPRLDGLELCLKGGQMGGPDFFMRARDGG